MAGCARWAAAGMYPEDWGWIVVDRFGTNVLTRPEGSLRDGAIETDRLSAALLAEEWNAAPQ